MKTSTGVSSPDPEGTSTRVSSCASPTQVDEELAQTLRYVLLPQAGNYSETHSKLVGDETFVYVCTQIIASCCFNVLGSQRQFSHIMDKRLTFREHRRKLKYESLHTTEYLFAGCKTICSI